MATKQQMEQAANKQQNPYFDAFEGIKPKQEKTTTSDAVADDLKDDAPKKSPAKTKKLSSEELKMFSVRMDSNAVIEWQAYTKTVEGTSGELTAKALREYMQNHAITDKKLQSKYKKALAYLKA